MANIETDRLLLRPAQWSDLDQLHDIFVSAEAMKYWSCLPHTSIEETKNFISHMLETPYDEGEDFIVEFDGKVIGKAGFWKLPEIGFIFHPDYWGKGLASEAVSAVLEYGFQVREIEFVKADVDPLNLASVRLLTGLGFHETGRAKNTFKLGELWCDSVYLGLKNPNV